MTIKPEKISKMQNFVDYRYIIMIVKAIKKEASDKYIYGWSNFPRYDFNNHKWLK